MEYEQEFGFFKKECTLPFLKCFYRLDIVAVKAPTQKSAWVKNNPVICKGRIQQLPTFAKFKANASPMALRF